MGVATGGGGGGARTSPGAEVWGICRPEIAFFKRKFEYFQKTDFSIFPR